MFEDWLGTVRICDVRCYECVLCFVDSCRKARLSGAKAQVDRHCPSVIVTRTLLRVLLSSLAWRSHDKGIGKNAKREKFSHLNCSMV